MSIAIRSPVTRKNRYLVLEPTTADKRTVACLNVRRIPPQHPQPRQHVIVTKPWGNEYLCGSTDVFETWELTMHPNSTTSLHCHPDKDTMLIVLQGTVYFECLARRTVLRQGEFRLVKAGAIHRTRTTTRSDARLLEIESPPWKYNLIRVQDDYGRTAKRYEQVTDTSARKTRIGRSLLPASGDALCSDDGWTLRDTLRDTKYRASLLPVFELEVRNTITSAMPQPLLHALRHYGISALFIAEGSLSIRRAHHTMRLFPGNCLTPVVPAVWNRCSTGYMRALLW